MNIFSKSKSVRLLFRPIREFKRCDFFRDSPDGSTRERTQRRGCSQNIRSNNNTLRYLPQRVFHGLTGTAVNPLFRAAYLAKEAYVRKWLEERVSFRLGFEIQFYPGKNSDHEQVPVLLKKVVFGESGDDLGSLMRMYSLSNFPAYLHKQENKEGVEDFVDLLLRLEKEENVIGYGKLTRSHIKEILMNVFLDHGPCVSDAHNTIVTERAGKDLVSSIVLGLLTIGPRFGGAIDDAARTFKDAYDRSLTPNEFVEDMNKKGIRVRRIGHRIKSRDNRDKRVELLHKLGSHSCFTKYPETNYLAVKPAEFPTLPNHSLIEVRKEAATKPNSETSSSEHGLDVISSANAEEAACVLDGLDESSSYGVSENGLKWWKQTGVEQRPDGVVCRWTMIREVTADGVVEWQDKYWEASDEFGFKELGSEKSGRDAAGNVWREFSRESMMQENGIVHMEKTADKWGKSGKGDECKRSGGSTTMLQKNQRNGLISGAS